MQNCIERKSKRDCNMENQGVIELKVEETQVVIFSPALNAVSGVSTHVNMLLGSTLADQFKLIHFQVGSEGRKENSFQRLARFLLSPLQLAVVLAQTRPRIVHINTSMDRKAFWRDIVYLFVAKAMGCKVVNQFHSGSSPERLFKSKLLRLLLRKFLLSADAVTVLSSSALAFHKAFDPRIAVELVPNAIDTSGLLDAARGASNDTAPLRLVYVGRLVRSKGLFDALEALNFLKADGFKFHLNVAGNGPDASEIRDAVARLGLEKEVTLLGPVFGAAKSKLWLESDVQVFPTYHNEGLPYSILESLAAGCVPITCSVAAIPDVMQDGVHGLFVPARDPAAVAKAIRRLDADRHELRRMAQAGRERIREQYTVDRLANRFGEIYQRLSK